VETLQTSVNEDWRCANNNAKTLGTDWFILTADFWLDETLLLRVRKSFRDCVCIKKFPYGFFMGSILSENLSKYEIQLALSFFTISALLVNKTLEISAWVNSAGACIVLDIT